jgi:hypothetical protein
MAHVIIELPLVSRLGYQLTCWQRAQWTEFY